MELIDLPAWDRFLSVQPEAHLLQTAAWGRLKAGFGWEALAVREGERGALLLLRRLPLGLRIAYLPKGPVGAGSPAEWRAFWQGVDTACRRRRAIFLKVEPDAWEEEAAQAVEGVPGFQPSAWSIQPRRTVVVDLAGAEEDILARMKQKTRYNIRLAQKKEVCVRESQDLDAFARLMQETGARDQFGVHSAEYYQAAYRYFHADGSCALLLAEYAGAPLAGLMVFARGQRAWYLYGASSDRERSRMPAYLLQWEAMRWARAAGCTEYDLWGAPDEDEATLEAQFEQRSDGLWGVYRFKRGFGGQLRRAAAAQDRVYWPLGYRLLQRLRGRAGL